jgi:hypothetical protein
MKPDGSEKNSTPETMEVMLDYLFTEDKEEENLHHKNIMKTTEEPISTSDHAEFTPEEIRHHIESFNDKEAPGIDGITGGIYLRTFNIFPGLVIAIYKQCLKRGCFPKMWKIAKIIPTIKRGKVNSMDPSKYRPIRLINTECPRRNVPDFGRMFLTIKYTDLTQNTYIRS